MNVYALLESQVKFPWLGGHVYLEGRAPSELKVPYSVLAFDEDLTAERFSGQQGGQVNKAVCTVTLYWPALADQPFWDEVLVSNQLKEVYDRIQNEITTDLYGLMLRGGVDMEGGPVGPFEDDEELGQMWGAVRFSYLVSRLKSV